MPNIELPNKMGVGWVILCTGYWHMCLLDSTVCGVQVGVGCETLGLGFCKFTMCTDLCQVQPQICKYTGIYVQVASFKPTDRLHAWRVYSQGVVLAHVAHDATFAHAEASCGFP
jgi:hypothetical protein